MNHKIPFSLKTLRLVLWKGTKPQGTTVFSLSHHLTILLVWILYSLVMKIQNLGGNRKTCDIFCLFSDRSLQHCLRQLPWQRKWPCKARQFSDAMLPSMFPDAGSYWAGVLAGDRVLPDGGTSFTGRPSGLASDSHKHTSRWCLVWKGV